MRISRDEERRLMRLLRKLAVTVGLASTASAQEHFRNGSVEATAPPGWKAAKTEAERLVVRSPDGREQATIALMRFGTDPSFDDFKMMCQRRLELEKEEADGFVQAAAPVEDRGAFNMLFSGGNKKTGRMYSGFLSLAKRELVTVYVEGIGVEPRNHLKSFESFVTGLRPR
jgi:hypothetical protein